MHEVTTHGLNCWTRSMFEKLGWMFLAYTKGYTSELDHYIENIQDLHTSVKEKINEVTLPDNKKDLIILKQNVESLLFFSNLMKESLEKHYENSNREERSKLIKNKIPKKDLKKKISKKSMNDISRLYKHEK
jgi:hypothetical protein